MRAIIILTALLLNTVLQAAPTDTDLTKATEALVAFSLELEDNTTVDGAVWTRLFAPVCAALYDAENFTPRAAPPLLSPSQARAHDLFQAYVARQSGLPVSIRAACKTIETSLACPTRRQHSGNRTFHADAAAQQAAHSNAVHQARRLTSTEHKRQERFRREELAQQRAEKRLAHHHTLNAQRKKSHKRTKVARANRRYSKWAKQECEKMRDKQRQERERERIHQEHSATVNKQAQDRAEKLKQAAQNLLK